MTANLFRPARRDGRSAWQVVYDLVTEERKMRPGDILTYEEVAGALELDECQRQAIYAAVTRANRELWALRNRSLQVVRGIGYRMLEAREHAIQAGGYQKQARRRMTNAVAVMDATNLDELTASQRDFNLRVTAALRHIARGMDSFARRQDHHDRLIRSLTERVTKLEEESDPPPLPPPSTEDEEDEDGEKPA